MPDETTASGTGPALDLGALDFAKGGGLVTVVAQDARSGAVLMVAHADREALERTLATGEMHYRSRSRGLWHKGATSGNVQRVVALSADCDGDAVLAQVLPAGPACHTGTTSCFGERALGADAFGALARTIEARVAEAEGRAAASDDPGATSNAGAREPAPSRSLERSQEGAREPAPSRRPERSEGGARGAPPNTNDRAATAGEHHQAAAPRTNPPPAKPSYTVRLLTDRNLRLKKLGEETAELVTACADGDAPRAAEEGMDVLYHALVALRALGVGLDDLRRIAHERAGAPRR